MTTSQHERYTRQDSLRTEFIVKDDNEVREVIFEALTKEQLSKDVQGKKENILDLIKCIPLNPMYFVLFFGIL